MESAGASDGARTEETRANYGCSGTARSVRTWGCTVFMWVARVGRTALARAQTAVGRAHPLAAEYVLLGHHRLYGMSARPPRRARFEGDWSAARRPAGAGSVEHHRLLAQSTHMRKLMFLMWGSPARRKGALAASGPPQWHGGRASR